MDKNANFVEKRKLYIISLIINTSFRIFNQQRDINIKHKKQITGTHPIFTISLPLRYTDELLFFLVFYL